MRCLVLWVALLTACGPRLPVDGAERLSAGRGSAQNPCLSPDGRSFVYTRFLEGYNEGPAELVLKDLASGDEEVLVEAGDADHVNIPGTCFSPDGARLAFSSDDQQRDEIWTIALSGGDRGRITDRPGSRSYEPTFSHDAAWLVFQSAVQGEDAAIWRIRADGTDEEALTSGSSDDRQPNASPVAAEVLFQSDRGGTWGLWTIALDGGEAAVLLDTDAEETDASWSQSGGSVVFATDDCDGISCIAELSGGEVDLLVEAEGWYLGAPALGGDGTVYFEGCAGDPEDDEPTAVFRVAP